MMQDYSQEMLTKHNCFMLQTDTVLNSALNFVSKILDMDIDVKNVNSFGNIFLIQNDSSIKLEDIEIIKNQFYVNGFNDKKVFIILEAEKLTKSAANSLLKILEDGSLSNIFIFATHNSKNVIQTINSRCLILNFQEFQDDNIIASMVEKMVKKNTRPQDFDDINCEKAVSYILKNPKYFQHLSHEEYFLMQSKIDYYLRYLTNNRWLKALTVLLQSIWQS
jgi:DNA polymerase-3 subunit delta'